MEQNDPKAINYSLINIVILSIVMTELKIFKILSSFPQNLMFYNIKTLCCYIEHTLFQILKY